MPRPLAVAVYLIVAAFGTYDLFRPTFESGFRLVQADRGDTVLNHYILEHSWQVLANRDYCGTALTPPFFHPQPLTIGYSETLIGAAPVYWLLRLGAEPVLAFQLWMIVFTWLNFAAMAAAGRKFGLPVLLAAAAAYAWTFALVHADQLRHPQMIPRCFCPFAALYAWRFVQNPGVRSLNRTAGCVALQTAMCVYTGWFLALGLVVFGLCAMPVSPRWTWRPTRRWRAGAVVLLAWAAVLGLTVAPHIFANRDTARSYAECVPHLPTVWSWLAAPPGGWWYATVKEFRPGVSGEATLFSGFAGLFAAAAGLYFGWRTKHPFALAATAAALVLVLLTADWTADGFSAWVAVRHFPGGSAIRVVGRVYVPVYLFATLGGFCGVAAGLGRVRAAWLRHALAAAVLAAVVFEQTSYPHAEFRADSFYEPVDECAALLKGHDAGMFLPTVGPETLYSELIGMWAGLRANVPVVNGYSGRLPPGYPEHGDWTDDDLRGWLRGKFRGTVAIIDPAKRELVRRVVIE